MASLAPIGYTGVMQELLTKAVELCEAATILINEVRARGFAVETKQDATPVTIADQRAEALITAGLRAAFPALPVIAEEEVAGGRITAPTARYWLVDPLDGTREFTAGRDEFTVNIGFIENGVPVLGAVATPAKHELHFGATGLGAWKRAGGQTQPIHARKPPPEGLYVCASRHYASDPALAACLAQYPIASKLNIGSGVKFLRIAEGVADFYPRLGRTMEWDTAAPQAVLEAAGGRVVLLNGAPLRYGKPGWENPDFFAWGLR
jgi:3'(2'), 5'-bisphosphate nucleotidase